MVPAKGSHPFDRTQINNLEELHEGGALAVGMIVCGKQAVWAYYSEINEEGRVNWNEAVEDNRHIPDITDLKHFLEYG
jgi:hypothetical protein